MRTKGSWAMQPSTSRVCGRTASTVCTKKPRPRSLPICPTPLMDVDDAKDRYRSYLAPRAPLGRNWLVPCSGAGEAASRQQTRSAFEQARNPKGSPQARLSACTARLVRRRSCRWTSPKVRSAQLLGFNNSCMCIWYSITL
jgi:hypothetical protein